MKRASWTLSLLAFALCAFGPAFAAVPPSVTATFDDLPAPPPLDSGVDLFSANGGGQMSDFYAGVKWGSGFTVVGDEYRQDSLSPVFGIPHSGHYYLASNGDDGLLITTSKLLAGAWFGRNAFYGYDNDPGGADQITITAMSGSTDKLSVSFNLPALDPGPGARTSQPVSMSFVDTSMFLGLTGITGYRIDRQPSRAFGDTWVADDFTFVAAAVAPVPEPGTWAMLLAGLALVGYARRRFG